VNGIKVANYLAGIEGDENGENEVPHPISFSWLTHGNTLHTLAIDLDFFPDDLVQGDTFETLSRALQSTKALLKLRVWAKQWHKIQRFCLCSDLSLQTLTQLDLSFNLVEDPSSSNWLSDLFRFLQIRSIETLSLHLPTKHKSINHSIHPSIHPPFDLKGIKKLWLTGRNLETSFRKLAGSIFKGSRQTLTQLIYDDEEQQLEPQVPLQKCHQPTLAGPTFKGPHPTLTAGSAVAHGMGPHNDMALLTQLIDDNEEQHPEPQVPLQKCHKLTQSIVDWFHASEQKTIQSVEWYNLCVPSFIFLSSGKKKVEIHTQHFRCRASLLSIIQPSQILRGLYLQDYHEMYTDLLIKALPKLSNLASLGFTDCSKEVDVSKLTLNVLQHCKTLCQLNIDTVKRLSRSRDYASQSKETYIRDDAYIYFGLPDTNQLAHVKYMMGRNLCNLRYQFANVDFSDAKDLKFNLEGYPWLEVLERLENNKRHRQDWMTVCVILSFQRALGNETCGNETCGNETCGNETCGNWGNRNKCHPFRHSIFPLLPTLFKLSDPHAICFGERIAGHGYWDHSIWCFDLATSLTAPFSKERRIALEKFCQTQFAKTIERFCQTRFAKSMQKCNKRKLIK
jgi:hypothetical protein